MSSFRTVLARAADPFARTVHLEVACSSAFCMGHWLHVAGFAFAFDPKAR